MEINNKHQITHVAEVEQGKYMIIQKMSARHLLPVIVEKCIKDKFNDSTYLAALDPNAQMGIRIYTLIRK